jgi:hypothetical protein
MRLTDEQIKAICQEMVMAAPTDSFNLKFARAVLNAASNVPDTLLVDLFYAAQGDITKFRIKARALLTEA